MKETTRTLAHTLARLLISVSVLQCLSFETAEAGTSYKVGDAALTCSLDHSSFCMRSVKFWQGIGQKNRRITATIAAGKDMSATCVDASVNVLIDDQVIYTSPLLSAGSTVRNVELAYLSPGTHSFEVKEASYDASKCPNPENGGSYYKYAIVVTFFVDNATKREFNVSNGSVAAVGDRISFSGQGWKAKGPPIRVSWGRKVIKSFPASRRFRGSFKLWDFPEKSTTACGGTVTARQGRASEAIVLTGSPDKYVYYASGLTRGDGETIRSGTILCGGLPPRKTKKYSWVWKGMPSDVSQPGVTIDDSKSGVQASAVFFGPTGNIRLARGREKPVTVSLNGSIGPSRSSLAPFDPGQAPGVVQMSQALFSGPTTFDVWYRSDHDVRVDGDVNLENAVLYVNGHLTINGSVTGTGALFATGNITLKGLVELNPIPPSNSITLLAGGDLVLGL